MPTPRRRPSAAKTGRAKAKKPARPRPTRRGKERSEEDLRRTIDEIIERYADALREMN